LHGVRRAFLRGGCGRDGVQRRSHRLICVLDSTWRRLGSSWLRGATL
jgi:hypothetical protein